MKSKKRYMLQAFVKRFSSKTEYVWRTVSFHDTIEEAEELIPDDNRDNFIIIDTKSQCNIGARIKALVRENGETIIEFAKRSGVSEDFFHRAATDNRAPRPSTLKKIATALNVPMEEFLVIGYDWRCTK